MRTLIAAFGVVLLVVTAIMPLGCARHNKTETFADYGFSFEYPAGYRVNEGGYTEGEENSYSSGSMMLSRGAPSQSDFYYVLRWVTTPDEEASQRESALWAALWRSQSDFEEGFATTGGSMEAGKTAEDSCSGHGMLRCYYKVTWSHGRTVNGEIGVVYCGESRRWFEMCTRSSRTENEAEAMDFFRILSSSFVCH